MNLKLNNPLMNIENKLITISTALFPLLYLTFRGWTNVFVFIFLGIGIYHFYKLPDSAKNFKNISKTEWLVMLAVISGFFAILLSQTLRHQISAKPYDGPLKLALAAPTFLLLERKKINFIYIFQYICPISLLIIFLTVHLDPMQMHTWGGRFSTYFVDPNSFGTYTMLLTFMCLFSLNILSQDNLPLTLLKILGFVTGFYLEMKSQTRGAWIAEPIMLTLWLGLHWKSKNKTSLIFSVSITILAILLSYCFVDFFHDRVNSIYTELYGWLGKSNTETSTGFRLSMWKISWSLFKESPWFGYGDLGYQYKLLLPEFQLAYSSEVISLMRQVGPHNELLANMIRSGIFGLIAVILELFIPAIIFIRGLHSEIIRVKANSIIGICFITGMIITSLSMEVLTLKYANSFYGLMIACLCSSVLWKESSKVKL